jgi:hypothetical protein
MISLELDLKIYTTFQIYTIIFGLVPFRIDDPWQHLPSVGGWQETSSPSHHQSCVFLTNMSAKRKSAWRNAIQVKNQRKTVGIE